MAFWALCIAHFKMISLTQWAFFKIFYMWLRDALVIFCVRFNLSNWFCWNHQIKALQRFECLTGCCRNIITIPISKSLKWRHISTVVSGHQLFYRVTKSLYTVKSKIITGNIVSFHIQSFIDIFDKNIEQQNHFHFTYLCIVRLALKQ